MEYKRDLPALTLTGTLIAGAIAPSHDHSQAPVSQEIEMYTVPRSHLWDNGPESPDRAPLPYVTVAPTTSTAVPSISLAQWDEMLRHLGS